MGGLWGGEIRSRIVQFTHPSFCYFDPQIEPRNIMLQNAYLRLTKGLKAPIVCRRPGPTPGKNGGHFESKSEQGDANREPRR